MKTIFKLILIIIALVCLASFASSYISPNVFWGFAFLSLGFKYAFLVNSIALFIMVIFRSKWLIIPLIPFVLGFSLAGGNIQFILKPLPENINNSSTVKVLSYNVRTFDFYNWTENLKSRENILNLIKDIDAGILCIQEFYSSDQKGFNNVDTLLKYQRAKYVHVEYTRKVYKVHFFGIATFSEFPIVNKGSLLFNKTLNNICIFTDIKIKDDTLRVYNMHLQSYQFGKQEYELMEDLQGIEDVSQIGEKQELGRSKKLVKRMRSGFKKRAEQTDIIREHISQSPYPVIVCGDFNDVPSSYVYRKLKGNLKDAFRESGKGLGTTYTGPFPEFRIDFILHDNRFNSYNFKTIRKKLSDHYPISTIIDLNSSSKTK